MALDKALTECFKDQPLTYTIIDNTVIIRQKAVLPPMPVTDTLVVVRGSVSDSATGVPVTGVTIQVKGEATGTETDVTGDCSLGVPENAVLEISYIGYNPKEIHVDGKSIMNI